MDAKTRPEDRTEIAPDGSVVEPNSGRISSRPARSASPGRRDGFQFSPINIRRWQNFKKNRRGYWSLWLFLVLFVLHDVCRIHR